MTLRLISISAVAWHAKSDASCIDSQDLTTCSTKGSALLQMQTGDLAKTTVVDSTSALMQTLTGDLDTDPSSSDLESRLKAVETQQGEDSRSLKKVQKEITALDDRVEAAASPVKTGRRKKGPLPTKAPTKQPKKGKTTDCSQMWWDNELLSLMTGPGTISGTPGSTSCESIACYDARKDGKCVVNSPCVMKKGNIGFVRCNAVTGSKKGTQEDPCVKRYGKQYCDAVAKIKACDKECKDTQCSGKSWEATKDAANDPHGKSSSFNSEGFKCSEKCQKDCNALYSYGPKNEKKGKKGKKGDDKKGDKKGEKKGIDEKKGGEKKGGEKKGGDKKGEKKGEKKGIDEKKGLVSGP